MHQGKNDSTVTSRCEFYTTTPGRFHARVYNRREILTGRPPMSTRRTLLTGALALAGGGAAAVGAEAPPAAGAPGRSSPALAPADVRHYGLVPNKPEAAAENTRALKTLVAPGGGFRGTLAFGNTTGSDVYHLNDIIPFADGIDIDLQGSTLRFTKQGTKSDTNAGFIFAVRDFTIQNGSIVIDYQMGGGGTNAGNALTFGNRGTDSQYFSPIYDSLLPVPMGNIAVRNLRISSNTAGGNGILMIGGLSGVVMENVWIDGSGVLSTGIYYEFGWATNEPDRTARQTSHAHNLRFVNISIVNIDTKSGQAFGLTGAYNCSIDGLYVRSSKILFQCSPGEATFFRPWKGVDQIGAKRNVALRNVVGVHITGTAISVTGASATSGGYLARAQVPLQAQVDLLDFFMESFAIDGGDLDGGYGIQSSAEKMDLRDGRITRFSRGIAVTDECTRMNIEGIDILDCRQWGILLGGFALFKPPRQKMGFIRGCFIAGNGAATPGNFAAIQLDQSAGFIIEGNRLGYEPAHDGLAETTQGFGIRLDANARGVVCRCNYVGGVRQGGVAYYNFATTDAQGNTLQNAVGVTSSRGAWLRG
jgi:hypothetical protein